MTEENYSPDDFDDLDHDIQLDDSVVNKRISVRYRRNDIETKILVRSLFFSQEIPVELLDISSKGAAIRSDKKLKLKKRVTLFVQFKDHTSFTIGATVVHSRAAPRYGLKFDTYQGELAEHLLATQTDLEFG